MDQQQQRAFLAASVAGILAAIGSVGFGHVAEADPDQGDVAACYGINKCKGTGDCGGAGHSCAGQNECTGKGYIELNTEDCLRIQGGSLQAAQTDQSKS